MAAQKLTAVVTRLVTKTPGTVVAFSKPRLATFWRYARVEMMPPSPSEFGQVSQGFNNLIAGARAGRWRNVTVKEAWINTLVAGEIALWFFVGECVGKGSLIGYNIPGAWVAEEH